MNKETLKVGEDLKYTNQLFKIDVRIKLSKVSNSNRFFKEIYQDGTCFLCVLHRGCNVDFTI